MRWPAVGGWLVLVASVGCKRAPAPAPAASVSGSATPLASVTPPPTSEAAAGLARFIVQEERGALWVHGSRLGVFDYDRGANTVVVSEPHGEPIECAARSKDGKLLVTISKPGSAALWNEQGALLGKLRGQPPEHDCNELQIRFAPAGLRVLVTVGEGPARLLGEGLAAEIPGNDGKKPSPAIFSPDGQRVYASGEKSTKVFEAAGAKLVRELSGHGVKVSPDGRFLAVSIEGGSAGLYDAESLKLLQTIVASSVDFHHDMIVAKVETQKQKDEDVSEGIDSQTIGYGLAPFEKRWDRRGIALYGAEMDRMGKPGKAPWIVGMGERGYSVFDGRSGKTVASWRSSGYGCGFNWAWEGDSLVFIEGDLITLWRAGIGAKTYHTPDCDGGEPVFSRDRTRVLGQDGIWDVTTLRRLTRAQLKNGGVAGFSHDERLILGAAQFGDSLDTEFAAWDARSGRTVWHKNLPRAAHLTANGSWLGINEEERVMGLLDVSDGSAVWFGILVDAEHGVTPLLFNDQCWAGPSKLPTLESPPEALPQQSCPELIATFQSKVRAQRSILGQ